MKKKHIKIETLIKLSLLNVKKIPFTTRQDAENAFYINIYCRARFSLMIVTHAKNQLPYNCSHDFVFRVAVIYLVPVFFSWESV